MRAPVVYPVRSGRTFLGLDLRSVGPQIAIVTMTLEYHDPGVRNFVEICPMGVLGSIRKRVQSSS